MRKFDEFEYFQNYFINLAMSLSMIQEECPPEIFVPMADAFLREYKSTLKLFSIEHSFKQQKRESKYRFRLLKKAWRKRIRREIREEGTVNCQAESEPSERINSEAVYAQQVDSADEHLDLSRQIESDKGSICLSS